MQLCPCRIESCRNKRNKGQRKCGKEVEEVDNVLAGLAKSDEPPAKMKLTASHKAFMDLHVTAHMTIYV